MTLSEYCIARVYAQLKDKLPRTPKESETLDVLRREVERMRREGK